MTIGLIYTALLGFGILYALVATAFSWFADHDFGGHADVGHADVGHGDVGHADAGQPHPLSGTVVATFITGFGGGGTLAHYQLEWGLIPGLLMATVAGALLAGAAFAVLDLLFSRTQAGSEFATHQIVGRTAEVITPIGADRSGEIAYMVKGQRERAAARSIDGTAIPRGGSVVIEKFVGATAFVRSAE